MKRRRNNLADNNMLTVCEPMATRIKELAGSEGKYDFAAYCNQILEQFVMEHRNGKPMKLDPDRHSEQNGAAQWDGIHL